MADTEQTVKVKVTVEDAASSAAGKISAAVKSIGAAVGSVANTAQTFSSRLLSVAGGNLLSSVITKGIESAKGSLDQASQAEEAEARLGVALRGNLAQIEAVNAAIRQTAASSVYSKAELTATADSLIARGVNVDKVAPSLKVIADTASALHQPLEEVANEVAMTFGGTVPRALGRIVPELKNLSAEALRSGAALDVLAKRYDGQAAAFANTDAGKQAAATRDIAQAWEDVGRSLLPIEREILPRVASGLKTVSEGFTAASGQGWGTFLSDMLDTLLGNIAYAGRFVSSMLVEQPLKVAKDGVLDLFYNIEYFAIKLFASIAGKVHEAVLSAAKEIDSITAKLPSWLGGKTNLAASVSSAVPNYDAAAKTASDNAKSADKAFSSGNTWSSFLKNADDAATEARRYFTDISKERSRAASASGQTTAQTADAKAGADSRTRIASMQHDNWSAGLVQQSEENGKTEEAALKSVEEQFKLRTATIQQYIDAINKATTAARQPLTELLADQQKQADDYAKQVTAIQNRIASTNAQMRPTAVDPSKGVTPDVSAANQKYNDNLTQIANQQYAKLEPALEAQRNILSQIASVKSRIADIDRANVTDRAKAQDEAGKQAADDAAAAEEKLRGIREDAQQEWQAGSISQQQMQDRLAAGTAAYTASVAAAQAQLDKLISAAVDPAVRAKLTDLKLKISVQATATVAQVKNDESKAVGDAGAKAVEEATAAEQRLKQAREDAQKAWAAGTISQTQQQARVNAAMVDYRKAIADASAALDKLIATTPAADAALLKKLQDDKQKVAVTADLTAGSGSGKDGQADTQVQPGAFRSQAGADLAGGEALQANAFSGITEGLSAVELKAKSAKQALKDMALSFIKAMLDIANQRVAEAAVSALSGGEKGGGVFGLFGSAAAGDPAGGLAKVGIGGGAAAATGAAGGGAGATAGAGGAGTGAGGAAAAGGPMGTLGDAFGKVVTTIEGAVSTVTNAIGSVAGSIVNGLGSALGGLLGGIGHAAGGLLSAAGGAVSGAGSAVASGAGNVISGVLAAFEGGGYSGDYPTDKVTGVVHGRERVMDAPTTARYGPVLEAMHAGADPGTVAGVLAGGRADPRTGRLSTPPRAGRTGWRSASSAETLGAIRDAATPARVGAIMAGPRPPSAGVGRAAAPANPAAPMEGAASAMTEATGHMRAAAEAQDGIRYVMPMNEHTSAEMAGSPSLQKSMADAQLRDRNTWGPVHQSFDGKR